MRTSFNDHALGNYLETIERDKHTRELVAVSYNVGALLRDPGGERLQIVRAKLKSLEPFQFCLSIGDLCARPEVDVPPSPKLGRARSDSVDHLGMT